MVVHLPLPLIPWPALCPATAITRALSFTSKASPGSQKFLPTLCFYSNFALYFAPWTCQPQIMQAILSVGVGLPLLFKPGFRCNSSRYSATGFWTPFSFILQFHSLSHFNQLISLLRLLFHTTPLNSTLRVWRVRFPFFFFDFVLGKVFSVINKGRLNSNPLCWLYVLATTSCHKEFK